MLHIKDLYWFEGEDITIYYNKNLFESISAQTELKCVCGILNFLNFKSLSMFLHISQQLTN